MTPFGLGLGLGFNRGGVSSQLVTPTLPQANNIVRAWSMRRLVPEFGNGIVGYADRDDPIPTNGFPLTFNDSGLISVTAGNPAFIYRLKDQKTNDDNADYALLVNDTFSTCPRIFNGTTIETGITLNPGVALRYIRGKNPDTALDTILGGDVTAALWFKTSVNAPSTGVYMLSLNDVDGRFYAFRAKSGAIIVYYGSSTSLAIISINYSDVAWHCIAMSASGSNVIIYYDGVSVGTAKNRTIAASPSGNTTIGGVFAAGQFDGSVNDIVVWNTALTGTEMEAFYNETKGHYNV